MAAKNTDQSTLAVKWRSPSDMKHTRAIYFILFPVIVELLIILNNSELCSNLVSATSINYGIGQQSKTDTNQLMPKLCQNQSLICESSFCKPNKYTSCVCDLRMPVKFGRFCLRQVDIETKCFVTNQCNHTIRNAVCVGINSNAVLDAEASKFNLEQWQQLNELRQMSQSALSKDVPKQESQTTTTEPPPEQMFLFDSNPDSFNFEARDDVIISNARNSPYEINYNTPELLLQNHTRRKTNQSDRSTLSPLNFVTPTSYYPIQNSRTDVKSSLSDTLSNDRTLTTTTPATPETTSTRATTTTTIESTTSLDQSRTTIRSINMDTYLTSTPNVVEFGNQQRTESNPTMRDPIGSTVSYSDLAARKKMVVKNPNWPPGVCSCPFGFMFDSMLRKCLALSLSESHCSVDTDCKQIALAHCSIESKKCECDEPLIWNQTELACVRPKPLASSENSNNKKETGGFVDNFLPPLILAKLLPDHIVLLLIFVIIVIIATLIILKIAIKCFSSSNSALISPKNKKKKTTTTNNLPPRSPYATLRRPDHKPSLSNFTQATRGRILNYDFEQEGSKDEIVSPESLLEPEGGAAQRKSRSTNDKVNTMRLNSKNHKQNHQHESKLSMGSLPQQAEDVSDQLMELNDNISISQLESESKSDNSILTIPAPPPNQPPPYMLATTMKGQGSAIAAAAAAVANKRMQKKNLEQQSGSKLPNGSPVFL